jgi:asparagine synthase (glutamine-hydrolysing)
MCGICGIYGHKDSSALLRMCKAIAHRGPDDEGHYIEEKIALGMKRLSIIDLATGHQPIFNEDHTIWLIANGEIYNYLALRTLLEGKGHQFRTKTDIETIVHLYEDHGEGCLQHLRGMFTLAIWDKPNERLFLARDRLGIKPLYYYYRNGILIFASEIKALLASGFVEKKVSKKALHYFLSFASIPPPLTIIEGIQSLLPGHFLKLEKEQLTTSSYWDINFCPEARKGESYYTQGIIELLQESIELRLISDVPLGVFLSGGIDSSTIVALMRQLHPGRIKTFSIGFVDGGERYNETKHARKVAGYFGTEHQEWMVSATDLLKHLPHIIWAMDQPTGDGINSYFISKFTKEKVTVALSGTGGDELFAGYEWYHKILRWYKLIHYLDKVPWPANFLILKLMHSQGYNFPDRRPYSSTSSSFESIYRGIRTLFHQEEIRRLFTPHFLEEGIQECKNSPNSYDPLTFFASQANKFNDVLHKICYMQLKLDMPNLLLRDIDVMSMIHSLEVRIPYLDHKLVEFVATIPPNLIIKKRQGKYILLQGLSRLLPKEILEREKMGFIFPMDYWLKGPLRNTIEQILSKESIQRRGIFSYESIMHIMKEFYKGRIPYFKLWNLIVLELWYRLYIDNDSFLDIPDRIEDLIRN